MAETQNPNPNLIKIDEATPEQIATICDHTFLLTSDWYLSKDKKCDAISLKEKDFQAFLNKAIKGSLKVYAVCVRGSETLYARKFIDNAHSPVKLAVTVGFPEGGMALNQKLYETRAALENGADEIDFVINWGDLRNGNIESVKHEMSELSKIIKNYGKKSKAILETSKLNASEIETACRCAEEAGIDFVKTSTTHAGGGATPEAIAIMRKNFSRGVKASGGINKDNVKDILRALSGRTDGYIELDPNRMRIGESSLFA